MLVTFCSKGTRSCTKCISENVSQNSSTFYSCLFLIFSVSYSLNLRASSIFRSFKLFREVWCYWMSCLSLSLCWLTTKVIHLLHFRMWLITLLLLLLLLLCSLSTSLQICLPGLSPLTDSFLKFSLLSFKSNNNLSLCFKVNWNITYCLRLKSRIIFLSGLVGFVYKFPDVVELG